ncbi:MAG: DUF3352 domain-containing protein [Methylacidiphilales bacterium]|nr:DUF3352 domain-containing protein [Candidatus Methylacidiphilales bacterium]NJR19974.1 DUF3352 domain-containing protein [Calothrix sp. CSU_2_0]
MPLPVLSVPTKKKKPSLVLTLSTTGVLVTGGIAAYWFITQGKPLSRDLPTAANVIPQDALFTVSLTTDSKQWKRLREFGTKELQTELDRNLVQLRDRFLANNGYDFQKDIQPWVGEEVTLAVLAPDAIKPPSKPVATDGKVANTQQMVMVLPIKNPENAKGILTQIKAPKGGNWRDKRSLMPSAYRTYQGVLIKESDISTGDKFSATVIDNKFVIITDSPKATEKAIDAYTAKTSLAKVPGLADNFPKIANYQPFAQFYINVPISAKIASAAPNRQLPAQVLTQLQNNQGLAGTITLENEGIRVKGVSWLNPNSQRTLAVENNAGEMQKRIPAETLMMLSGGNLQRTWADYVSTSQGNPLSPLAPEKLRTDFKSLTNMDLERDLLSWMGNEYSLSVVPVVSKAGADESFRAALMFMVKVSNKNRAEASLKELDEVMRSQYQFRIEEKNISGKLVTNWIGPFGTLTASHGWLDDKVTFLTIGAPITEKIISNSGNSLSNAAKFQKTLPSELNPTNGQFYLDVDGIQKNFPLPLLFPNQPAILSSTHSIGMTSAVSDNRSARYDIFLSLKKLEK